MTIDCRLSNATSRPVQLHLPDGVTVLPANGMLTCPAATLDDPQIRVLCRTGVLHVLPGEPATFPPSKPRRVRAKKPNSARPRGHNREPATPPP